MLLSSVFLLAAVSTIVSGQTLDQFITLDPSSTKALNYDPLQLRFKSASIRTASVQFYDDVNQNITFSSCSKILFARSLTALETYQSVTLYLDVSYLADVQVSKTFSIKARVTSTTGATYVFAFDVTWSWNAGAAIASNSNCSIYGDPHVVSWSSQRYEFQQYGFYELARTPRLIVKGHLVPFGQNGTIMGQITYNYLGIEVGTIAFNLVKNFEFFRDTMDLYKIKSPPMNYYLTVTKTTTRALKLAFSDGSVILAYLDSTNSQHLDVSVPKYYGNDKAGLCANQTDVPELSRAQYQYVELGSAFPTYQSPSATSNGLRCVA